MQEREKLLVLISRERDMQDEIIAVFPDLTIANRFMSRVYPDAEEILYKDGVWFDVEHGRLFWTVTRELFS